MHWSGLLRRFWSVSIGLGLLCQPALALPPAASPSATSNASSNSAHASGNPAVPTAVAVPTSVQAVAGHPVLPANAVLDLSSQSHAFSAGNTSTLHLQIGGALGSDGAVHGGT